MRSRRGSALVMCLLLSILLLVMGMALLGSRGRQYGAAHSARAQVQARWLAEAGLQDALVKLRRVGAFPPRGAEDQRLYSYSEDVSDLQGRPLGSYVVEIDETRAQPPFLLLKVRALGLAGPSERPQAQARLEVELDLDPTRGTFFQVVNRRDISLP